MRRCLQFMIIDIDYYRQWQECTRGNDNTSCDDELLLHFIRSGEYYVIDLLTRVHGDACCCGVRYASDDCGGGFESDDTVIKNAVCEYAYAMWKIDSIGEEENAEVRDLYKRNSYLLLKNRGYLRQ